MPGESEALRRPGKLGWRGGGGEYGREEEDTETWRGVMRTAGLGQSGVGEPGQQ